MRFPKFTILAEAKIEFETMSFEGECLIEHCELIGRKGIIGHGRVFQGEIGKVSILNCILRGTAAEWMMLHIGELEKAHGNWIAGPTDTRVEGTNLIGGTRSWSYTDE